MKLLILNKYFKSQVKIFEKPILVSGLIVMLVLKTAFIKASAVDSLRLAKEDGKNFVIHKVDKGQTLFGLLRKYGSNITEFKTENPDMPVDIKIGQILRIPYKKPIREVVKTKPKTNSEVVEKPIVNKEIVEKPARPVSGNGNTVKIPAKTIVVAKGMTLFSIASKNNLTLAQIRKMNNLKSDVVQIGQTLIVKEGAVEYAQTPKNEPVLISDSKPKIEKKAEAPKETSKPNEVLVVEVKPKVVVEKPIAIEEKKVIEPAKKVELEAKTESKVLPAANTTKPKIDPVTEPEKPTESANESGERVLKVEEGVAELIEVESRSGKYLALHKTAPIGTLVQVKNESNGASVWVKVIGRLPALDQNENIIIKLSPRAMARVSPVDKKFRAKINYSL